MFKPRPSPLFVEIAHTIYFAHAHRVSGDGLGSEASRDHIDLVDYVTGIGNGARDAPYFAAGTSS